MHNPAKVQVPILPLNVRGIRDQIKSRSIFSYLKDQKANIYFQQETYSEPKDEAIGHFTVVCLVTWPLSGSEAGGDLVLIQTLLLFTCKSFCSLAN